MYPVDPTTVIFSPVQDSPGAAAAAARGDAYRRRSDAHGGADENADAEATSATNTVPINDLLNTILACPSTSIFLPLRVWYKVGLNNPQRMRGLG